MSGKQRDIQGEHVVMKMLRRAVNHSISLRENNDEERRTKEKEEEDTTKEPSERETMTNMTCVYIFFNE